MQNPHAIVSNTIRFNPPIKGSPTEMFRERPELSVELEGGRTVRFDPSDPRSIGFIQVLDGLNKQNMPVYVELEPNTSFIKRILIPYLTRVADLRVTNDNAAIEIIVEFSHARHFLQHNQEDYPELQRVVNEALQTGQPVIMTEDERHNIIDIRFFKPNPEELLPYPKPPPRIPPPWPWPWEWIRRVFRKFWLWPWWPWWWFGCISVSRAQQVFNTLNATSCNPLTVPLPCIPFLYPDDGCWGRAHEMRRLMADMGLSVKKIWIQGSLHVNTRNNPNCFVGWGWHVAPTLCVRGPGIFQKREMVIDPSLFTTPVTQAAWKGVQGDPSATLTPSAGSIFYYWGSVTDPTYSQTNSVLAMYRLQLQNRAISFGPPPYANCP